MNVAVIGSAVYRPVEARDLDVLYNDCTADEAGAVATEWAREKGLAHLSLDMHRAQSLPLLWDEAPQHVVLRGSWETTTPLFRTVTSLLRLAGSRGLKPSPGKIERALLAQSALLVSANEVVGDEDYFGCSLECLEETMRRFAPHESRFVDLARLALSRESWFRERSSGAGARVFVRAVPVAPGARVLRLVLHGQYPRHRFPLVGHSSEDMTVWAQVRE